MGNLQMLPLQAMQQAITVGHNVWLLIVGIILIVIGAVMPQFLPAGNKGWYALLIIGVIVVVIWLILLVLEITGCC